MADNPNVLDYTVGDFNYRRATGSTSATVATPRQIYGVLNDGITVTLASSMHQEGVWVGLKDEAGSAGGVSGVTVDGDGTNIDGSTSFMLNANFEGVMVYSDGTNWFSLGVSGSVL